MVTALACFRIVADLLDFEKNAVLIVVLCRIYCGLFNRAASVSSVWR